MTGVEQVQDERGVHPEAQTAKLTGFGSGRDLHMWPAFLPDGHELPQGQLHYPLPEVAVALLTAYYMARQEKYQH